MTNDGEGLSSAAAGSSPRFSRRALGIGALASAGALAGNQRAARSPSTRGQTRTHVQGAESNRLTVAFPDDEAARIAPLLDEFEAQHGIQLAIRSAPAAELYEQYTIDLLQQTAVIDVASLRDTWLPQFTAQPVLSDLSPLLRPEDGVAPIGPALRLGETPSGRMAGIPWAMDLSLACITGIDSGSPPPQTWADWDLLANASLAMPLVAAEPVESASMLFRAVMASFDEPIIRVADREPQLYTDTAQQAVERLLVLTRQSALPALGIAQPALIEQLTESAGVTPVCWASAWVLAGRPDTWTLMPTPGSSAARGGALIKGSLLVVPEASTAKELATTFVSWFSSRSVQEKLLPLGCIPVARPIVYGSAADGSPVLPQAIREALARPVLRPHIRSHQDIDVILSDLVHTVVSGTVNSQRALADAQYAIRQALRQEGELLPQ